MIEFFEVHKYISKNAECLFLLLYSFLPIPSAFKHSPDLLELHKKSNLSHSSISLFSKGQTPQ
jgi:hypothetical protein